VGEVISPIGWIGLVVVLMGLLFLTTESRTR
jgi:drug/metabolite transporter (DMT)-like permease